jgi:hypothetical protein
MRFVPLLLVLSAALVCVAFSPHPRVCRFRHKNVGLQVSNLQESAPTKYDKRNDEKTSVLERKVKELNDPFITATITVKSDYAANVDNRLETTFMNDAKDDDSSITQVLGVPQWLKHLPKGESLYASRQVMLEGETSHHPYFIQRVSSHPPIFLFKGILTGTECHDIAREASHKTATPAQTGHNQGATARPRSSVVWLNNWDFLAESVAQSSVSLDDGAAWVESMQVVTYTQEGEYVLHHDGNERIATALYYLNGVGGTWFPLADCNTAADSVPTNRQEALEMTHSCIPGKDGLLIVGKEVPLVEENDHVIQVQAGDAVLFYNYLVGKDERARSDWTTIHAGLPSPETKLIANHWFHMNEENEKEGWPDE